MFLFEAHDENKANARELKPASNVEGGWNLTGF